MGAIFKNVTVSRDSVLKAMREFDSQYQATEDYDNWMSKGNYRYAVRHGEHLYPVKRILSDAITIPTSEFSGGENANRVFRELGFQVIAKPVTGATPSAV